MVGQPSPKIRSEDTCDRVDCKQQADFGCRIAQRLQVKGEIRRECADKGEIGKIKSGEPLIEGTAQHIAFTRFGPATSAMPTSPRLHRSRSRPGRKPQPRHWYPVAACASEKKFPSSRVRRRRLAAACARVRQPCTVRCSKNFRTTRPHIMRRKPSHGAARTSLWQLWETPTARLCR